ncbi:fucose mutarotase isoform X1 [Manis javanica]|uniref:fucose mutarotase isoform X1 n=1 Tax=Manis javanica TaxID=9974 RepID=UPI003C6D3D03
MGTPSAAAAWPRSPSGGPASPLPCPRPLLASPAARPRPSRGPAPRSGPEHGGAEGRPGAAVARVALRPGADGARRRNRSCRRELPHLVHLQGWPGGDPRRRPGHPAAPGGRAEAAPSGHAVVMELVPSDRERGLQTPVWKNYQSILSGAHGTTALATIERFEFYQRAKKAFAVVATGETALYGNLILKKGVLAPCDLV